MSPLARSSGPPLAMSAFLNRSHASEYIGIGALLGLYLGVVLRMQPYHRMFCVNDLAISFPHAEVEHVSVIMNFVWALYVPLAILIGVNIISRSRPHKHEATYLSFVISILVATVLTDLIKNFVGRPRPDMLARCIPAADTPKDILVSFDVCTAAPGHKLTDGFRSFPSGHSSFAFSGLGYLTFWLSGQLHVFTSHGRRNLWKTLICMCPVVGALLIAISRCEDYRHDVWDVSVGSLLGWTIAYWSYRRHFPCLTEIECDEPYPRSGENNARDEFQRIGDEEALSQGIGNTILP